MTFTLPQLSTSLQPQAAALWHQLVANLLTPISWGDLQTPVLSLLLGAGISSACGFRVFLPFLTMSVGAHFFGLHLPGQLTWLNSDPALWTLIVAAGLEMAGFYIPWVDNLLDGLMGPAAIIAGTFVTGAFLDGHVNPGLQWALALIAGGAAAGSVAGASTLVRGTSSALTFGLGNPLVATGENLLALVMPILGMVLPYLVMFLAGLLLMMALLAAVVSAIWFTFRWLRRRRTQAQV
jgi:hypothetical protein